jgi:hypothetical protein
MILILGFQKWSPPVWYVTAVRCAYDAEQNLDFVLCAVKFTYAGHSLCPALRGADVRRTKNSLTGATLAGGWMQQAQTGCQLNAGARAAGACAGARAGSCSAFRVGVGPQKKQQRWTG